MGLVALVVAIYRYPAVYATRMRLVIVASLVPIVGSVLYAAGLDASVHADLSSIAFAIAGLIAAWAVLRFRLLDVVPVAWPTLVDSLADAVLVLDPERRIAAFNLSATRLLGIGRRCSGAGDRPGARPVPRARGRLPGNGRPGGRDPGRTWGAQAAGSERSAIPPPAARWFNVRVTAIGDERGRDAGCLVVLRDVTEHRQMVETIRTLSLTDELTGLLNRRGFTTLAEQQMRTSVRTRNRLWLLFADLDGLKEINDRLGHEAGDRALCEIARLLRTGSFRQADLVARLGGDEFAILATEISRDGRRHAREACRRRRAEGEREAGPRVRAVGERRRRRVRSRAARRRWTS